MTVSEEMRSELRALKAFDLYAMIDHKRLARWATEHKALEAENAELRKLLRDALYAIEDGMEYGPKWFEQAHRAAEAGEVERG